MKIALVTGGSRGLGKSMVLHLAKKGYYVVFTYKSSKDEAENLIKEIKFMGEESIALELDISMPHTLDDFISKLKETIQTTWQQKNIDLLVNNAGIGINEKLEKTTEEQFDQLVNIHLKGPYFLTQKLIPNIKDAGSIINISSGLTRFSLAGYSAYAMMKGAVEVMTRYLALELKEKKITVNTIAPGAIETDFANGAVRDIKEINQYIASQTALGRVGLADDIGAALAQLTSSECHWLNGQRVELSGGIFL
jgi:NAD(P)-dependent dehydrogenase (short-subunit alcohol dehydrogenase family)